MDVTDAAFRLTDVGCGLGGRTILSEVALDIRRSHVLALVGPNGAGKSTLLGVLTGDVARSSGRGAVGRTGRSTPGVRACCRARGRCCCRTTR